MSGSTDVADVSWTVPVAQITTATAVPGTPGHSWQNAACAGSSIGRKGMVLAAKTLALTQPSQFARVFSHSRRLRDCKCLQLNRTFLESLVVQTYPLCKP